MPQCCPICLYVVLVAIHGYQRMPKLPEETPFPPVLPGIFGSLASEWGHPWASPHRPASESIRPTGHLCPVGPPVIFFPRKGSDSLLPYRAPFSPQNMSSGGYDESRSDGSFGFAASCSEVNVFFPSQQLGWGLHKGLPLFSAGSFGPFGHCICFALSGFKLSGSIQFAGLHGSKVGYGTHTHMSQPQNYQRPLYQRRFIQYWFLHFPWRTIGDSQKTIPLSMVCAGPSSWSCRSLTCVPCLY